MRIWTDRNYPIIISCAKGLAEWTRHEVESLGYRVIDETENTVVIRGAMREMLNLNLRLRTAHRVLVPLLRARCTNLRHLYSLVNSIDWENQLDENGYFSVSSVAHNRTVRDTRMPSLVTKDAIADRMRERCLRRPDSGGENIGAAVFVYWEDDQVIVYLDTSGEPLSKRGYRKIPGSAPMQETLAAACIQAMRWDGRTPFISPMCGSGTPAIEATLIALNRAPGMFKTHFAFMSLKGYTHIVEGLSAPKTSPRSRFGVSPEQFWKEMKFEAREAEVPPDRLPPIIATDISPEAVDNARTNAIAAGVSEYITFAACDFAKTEIPDTPDEPAAAVEGNYARKPARGAVFFNPEYGIRLGDPKELAVVYERIGDFLKQKCNGYTGAVLTGSKSLAQCIGLRTAARIPFFNGPIDCRLLIYPMYS